MDGQGRIPFRRNCGASWASRISRCGCSPIAGRIEVLSEQIYEERKREAAQTAAEDVDQAGGGGAESDALCMFPSWPRKRWSCWRSGRTASIWTPRPGLGGHTALIAQRLTTGLVIANDRDAQSLEMARRNTAEWADRIRFHQGRFGELAEAVAEAGFEQGGRPAGGPGGEPLSAHGAGARFFVFGGWAAGHAHGSNPRA